MPFVSEAMKQVIKEVLNGSLAHYTSSAPRDWVTIASSYRAHLALQVSFTRDVKEAFLTRDSSLRAFHQFQATLKHCITTLFP
jgi:hypothetical protein